MTVRAAVAGIKVFNLLKRGRPSRANLQETLRLRDNSCVNTGYLGTYHLYR